MDELVQLLDKVPGSGLGIPDNLAVTLGDVLGSGLGILNGAVGMEKRLEHDALQITHVAMARLMGRARVFLHVYLALWVERGLELFLCSLHCCS